MCIVCELCVLMKKRIASPMIGDISLDLHARGGSSTMYSTDQDCYAVYFTDQIVVLCVWCCGSSTEE